MRRTYARYTACRVNTQPEQLFADWRATFSSALEIRPRHGPARRPALCMQAQCPPVLGGISISYLALILTSHLTAILPSVFVPTLHTLMSAPAL